MLPRITIFLAILVFSSRAYCAALVPISRSAITQAISRGVNTTPASSIAISEDDIQLSIFPQARTASPVLLVSVKDTADHGGFWVRVRCRQAADCMSFLVLLRPDARTCENIRQVLAKKAATRTSLPLVPAGTRMHLVCRRGSVLISMQVRSLRPAHVGDDIRVYDGQSRRTYLGRLAAPGLVETSY